MKNLKKTITRLKGKHSLFYLNNYLLYSRKRMLCILLLLLVFSLSGHSQQFTVYKTWDFESATLGAYDSAAIVQDFDITTSKVYDHDAGSIVMDTINGTPTKVLKVTHEADKVSVGFQVFAKIPDSDWNEVYLSYNVKFSEEFNSTRGGKLPGLAALPEYTSQQCPVSGQGFGGVLLFKRAGFSTTYHYDNTTGDCPWSGDDDSYNYMTDNTVFMANGIWYNITQRYVVNSFSGGTPQDDGIRELWINGKMTHQLDDLLLMLDDEDSMKIDDIHVSNFYGGDADDYKPATECYAYFDNFKLFIPGNDSISGYELHHPSAILPTPDEITDRTFYYDSLRTTEGTLSNMQYGSNYTECRDETFLIDAGAGNAVSFNITTGGIGGGEYLFFYDGNTADADLIEMVVGSDFSFTGTRQSTGRYMFVRFSTDVGSGTTGWSGTIDFIPIIPVPDDPTNLTGTALDTTTIQINWVDNADDEDKFIIERSTGGAGFAVIDSIGADTTTYTDTGLTPRTTYLYRVKAKNSYGSSDYTNVKTIKTISAGLVNTIKVNFTQSGYSGGSEWNDFLTYSSGSSISLDDSLENSTGYTLYNEDSWSGTNSAGELSGPYPQDVNRTYWFRETNECDLELRNLNNDNLYSIEVYGSRDNPGVTRETRVTIGEEYDIVTVNDNTSDKAVFSYLSPSSGVIRLEITPETDIYSYINAMVIREYTESVIPPTAPSNLHATDSTTTSISLAWTDSNYEDKFIIERSLSAGSGFAAIDSVGTDTTTYTDTGLSPETTYYYRVKAKNSTGESAYCDVLGVTTLSEPETDTILVSTIKTNFTMTGFTGVSEWNDFTNYSSGSSISLDDSLDNSTGYTLYNEDSWSAPNSVGELTGPYPEDVNRTYWYIESSECDLELRNLDNDNLYTIEAYASRANPGVTRETRVTIGSDFDIITVSDNTSDKAIFPYVSPSSGVIRIAFTPETDIYAYLNALVVKEYEVSSNTIIAPSALEATDSTTTTVTLGWVDGSDNEDKFIIERSTGAGFAAIDSVGTDTTTYTDTGLSPETTYYYRVKAKNSTGESAYCDSISVTTLSEPESDTTLVCTIKTNFTMTGYTGVSEWNDFTNYSSGSSISLDDSLDNSTGYTLYNEDSWSAPNFVGELTGPYPEDVNRTYWYRNTTECDLELRNLDNDNLYTIEAYASRDNPGVTRETRVTIGSDFDIITVNDNTSDKAIFPYVSPSSGVIRIAFTPETDIYAYLNALVVKEYEVSSDTAINDTIALINFMPNGYSETGWVNVRHYSDDFPADLGNGISLSRNGDMDSNNAGEPSTILPSNVGGTYCFITAANETPVVFTVSGLDTTKAYAFDFFASRDDAVSGDRTTYFSIGDDTVSIDALGNTDNLLTISAVSPNSSGNITINMFRPTGQYGYINAMIIRDIGEKSASLSRNDNIFQGEQETEQLKVFPNPGSTMITITGFDKAIEIKIVDMLGKVVFQKGYAAKSTQVDVSNLKKGLYLIMLKTENNYHMKKFIKN